MLTVNLLGYWITLGLLVLTTLAYGAMGTKQRPKKVWPARAATPLIPADAGSDFERKVPPRWITTPSSNDIVVEASQATVEPTPIVTNTKRKEFEFTPKGTVDPDYDMSPMHANVELAGYAADDPVSTQLDLARAYIDMGDLTSAQEILQTILHQGSERQKAEAQTLLAECN